MCIIGMEVKGFLSNDDTILRKKAWCEHGTKKKSRG